MTTTRALRIILTLAATGAVACGFAEWVHLWLIEHVWDEVED